jgi:TRAP transporter TAXI family solute receptor
MKIRYLMSAGAVLFAAQAFSAPQFINVLTGGTSGAYYPIGVALSQIYSDVMPDAKMSVQSTKASVENLNLLQAGKGEVALALGDAVSGAWKGDEEAGFKTPLTNLRAISAIYPNYIQIVASKDSGIKTLADLKGKRISVGAPKSGTELNARAIFAAAGLTYDDFSKTEYLSFSASVELMKNRQLDATLQSAGLGVASLRDLSTSINVVFIPIPANIVAKINDAAYEASVIPANTYDGQTEDLSTVAIRNILVTSAVVPEETVYLMTKSMFEHLDQLVTAHKAAAGIDKSLAAVTPIPLHAGAEKYYKEIGLLK